ncbi:MAG: hypothetical protein KGQ59_06780 [Bdellovibrionales bacterium]|nr:hypothetical protein [Bdellovibrionales bacterium]
MTTFSLTTMILLPFLGAAAQAIFVNPRVARWVALSSSLLSTAIGLAVLGYGLAGVASDAFTDRLPWVGSYAISYELAVDGISRVGVLLVSILFPVLIASEWGRARGARGMHALFLILQGALLGTACSQDLFLLFFFWSISSVPVFFLVGIWGGEKKESAAFRTLVTSALGNALLLGAFILIYYSSSPHTFLMSDLLSVGVPEKMIRVAGLSLSASKVAFLFIFLATALRAPIWPLHGWFTQMVAQAPASVVVAIAGAVVPSGILVFSRLSHGLFPEIFSSASGAILVVGLINIAVGTCALLLEKELSALLAWITITQVGLSMIALGSGHESSMVGLVYQQLSMSLALAGLGLVLGALRSRGATKWGSLLDEGSGVSLLDVPVAGVVTAFSIATVVGFPGLCGFIGQSLIVLGGFERSPWIAVLVGISCVLLFSGLFGVYRALFFSPAASDERASTSTLDLSLREKGYLIPLVVLMVILGVYPKPILDEIKPAAEDLLKRVHPRQVVEPNPTPINPEGTPVEPVIRPSLEGR